MLSGKNRNIKCLIEEGAQGVAIIRILYLKQRISNNLVILRGLLRRGLESRESEWMGEVCEEGGICV